MSSLPGSRSPLVMMGLLLISLFSSVVLGVDKSKFRTCEQGSFCNRWLLWVRENEANPPPVMWRIVEKVNDFSYLLENSNEPGASLKLDLKFYKDGALRVKVNEIKPLWPRYEIPHGDVLVDTEFAENIEVSQDTPKKRTTYKMTAANGSVIEAHLMHAPLQIFLYSDGHLTLSVNRRNTFNFEKYRHKGVTLDHTKTIDSVWHPRALHRGDWEENFGSHRDDKPRGPAAFGLDIQMEGEVHHVFGLPEHATGLDLQNYQEPYRFYNLDVFEYELDSPMALYGAVPMLWGNQYSTDDNKKLQATSGILWMNPSETFVKVEKNSEASWWKGLLGESGFRTWWVSESGVMDFFLMSAPSPRHISWQFHRLTGFAPMAPMFALGKHQCRWNYVSEKDVLEVHSNFESYDIPYDVLWLDIEHTDGKRYFTWDKRHFPNPVAMTDKLSSEGRKLVTIVDPHIKSVGGYEIFKDLSDKDLLMKQRTYNWKDGPPVDASVPARIKDINIGGPPEGYNEAEDGKWEHPSVPNPAYKTLKEVDLANSPSRNFEGWCWPGQSVYPDFTNPQMRNLWRDNFALSKYHGTTLDTYTWNDMNEPSVFNGPEVSAPRHALHMGEVEHRDVHNLYGMYVQRATFEGHLAHKQGKRPFVLSRSFFTGSHRYGAIWTGDNFARWDHLKASVAMTISHALGGISFIGADIGGFFKNPEEELMVRWYQFGSIAYPFMRNHAHLETARREPWKLSKDNLWRVKTAIKQRYTILPFYYTLFYQYTKLGLPIIRPLWYDFHSDLTVYVKNVGETQTLVGGVLLTKVISDPGVVNLPVYLPNGASNTVWYDWHSHEPFAGGSWVNVDVRNQGPLFVAGGKIIPTKTRQRRSASLMKRDPFTLNVFLGPNKKFATGRVYIDDYENVATSWFESKFELSNKETNSTGYPVLRNTVIESSGPDAVDKILEAWGGGKEVASRGMLVERIVLAGLGEIETLKRVYLWNEKTGEETDLQFRIDATDVVIVKKPTVKLNENWTIKFSEKAIKTDTWEAFYI